MKYSIVVELDDGRKATVPVNLEFRRDGMFAALDIEELEKSRLYAAFVVLRTFVTPAPILPLEVLKAVTTP